MMSGIRGRDTRPEMQLRRFLHRAGFRFRLQDRRLPGRPDIVLPRYRAAILVHGCFWHRHAGCRYCTVPATRPEFWQRKFSANMERDQRNIAALEAAGWRVAIVWECALKKNVPAACRPLLDWLRNGSARSKARIEIDAAAAMENQQV